MVTTRGCEEPAENRDPNLSHPPVSFSCELNAGQALEGPELTKGCRPPAEAKLRQKVTSTPKVEELEETKQVESLPKPQSCKSWMGVLMGQSAGNPEEME